MTQTRTLILGIPVDDLTMPDTVQRILEMTENYRQDQTLRAVATINVDFLVNCLSWSSRSVRYREVVTILRQASLVTADGMPIVWLSTLLGGGLPERVPGSDLVPQLAQEAAARGKSLYLLGGRVEAAKQAADYLRDNNPSLRVAGVDSPFVHTEGEKLGAAVEEDETICSRINAARPDILLVGFGNPKQELWIHRNRHRLEVPVAIGVGGTFHFLAGDVRRAPEWMQRFGMEWVYRLWREPRRLWRRYCLGLLKFGFMAGTAVTAYALRRAVSLTARSRPDDSRQGLLFLSAGKSIHVVSLPPRVNGETLDDLREEADVALLQDAVVVDFRQVLVLTASAMGFLCELYTRARDHGKPFYGMGLRSGVRVLLEANRMWDLLEDCMCADPKGLVARFRERWSNIDCFFCVRAEQSCKVLGFFGQVDALQLAEVDVKSLISEFIDTHCVVDLSYCSFIDSTGLSVLVQIFRKLNASGKAFIVCGPRDDTKRALKLVKLDNLFPVVDTLPEARRKIAEHEQAGDSVGPSAGEHGGNGAQQDLEV